jgi:hypothetical protein
MLSKFYIGKKGGNALGRQHVKVLWRGRKIGPPIQRAVP